MVEEKGPINFANELEGDEDEQISDYDDDEMTYPGDPLHLSDYEEAEGTLVTCILYITFPYKEILKMVMIIELLDDEIH